jgi:hypothetical protein
LIKGLAGQRRLQVIAGGGVGEFVHDLQREVQVLLLAAVRVEQGERVDDGLVHLGAAGVNHAAVGAEELLAEQVADAPGAAECCFIAAQLVPRQQPEHDVVVPPGVPRGVAADVGGLAGQAILFREWAEVAVLRLEGDEAGDELLEVFPQRGVAGEAEHLRRAGQVLTGELARPRQQVAVGLAVPLGEHRQHRGVVGRRAQQPVARDLVHLIGDGTGKLERRVGRPVKCVPLRGGSRRRRKRQIRHDKGDEQPIRRGPQCHGDRN